MNQTENAYSRSKESCEAPRSLSNSELVVPVKRTFIHYETCQKEGAAEEILCVSVWHGESHPNLSFGSWTLRYGQTSDVKDTENLEESVRHQSVPLADMISECLFIVLSYL